MNFLKRIMAIVLSFVMIFTSVCVFNTVDVNATSKTAAQGISWVQSKVGTAIDWDGVYGAQCVDLIAAYYNYLGVTTPGGNGCDYATNALPSGWSRVKGGTPQKGDILVYSGNSNNPAGHVAIYESDRVHYHQNFASVQKVQKITYMYNGLDNPYWGYIRPNWGNTVTVGNSTISVTKGDSATATTWSWTKAANATTYNLRIKKYNGTEYVTYKDVWNLTGTSYSIVLPPGDYYAYVDACNGSAVTRSTNSAYCTIKYWYAGKTINNLGDDFYARIVLTHTNIAPGVNSSTNNIENVDYTNKTDTAYCSQFWHFVRNDDGSYRILNTCWYEGYCMEAEGTTSGSNVKMSMNYQGKDTQHWYVYGAANGQYIIRNKASEFVLNVHNAYSAVGTNLQIWKYTDSVAERMTIEKHTTHSWNSGSITTQPSCTSAGVKTYTCLYCGQKKTESVAKKPHNIVKDAAVAATCISTGLTEGEHCTNCDYKVAQQVVTNGDHHYGAWRTVKNATCEREGQQVRSCELCNDQNSRSIDKLPHEPGDWEVESKGTMSDEGLKISYCQNCGEECDYAEIAPIDVVEFSKATYVYDGKVKNPSVVVEDINGEVISTDNYTVKKLTSRKNVGKHGYKITFKNEYKGTKTIYFKINPKATSITSKPTAAKKAFTVKWKKVSTQATGYQIMYATNKSFTKGKKTVTVKSYKTTSKKITKLSAKKTYYVKVRTYKTVNGTKYYSAWSAYKTVKTR